MRARIPILILSLGFGSRSFIPARSQLVRSYRCEDEHVSPNLHMTSAAEVRGIVRDQTGAAFSGIVLQIQDPRTAKVLGSAVVGKSGEFGFGLIPIGDFRFLPVKTIDGKVTRLPGFDPPASLTCSDGNPCELQIVLPVRPTDLPYTNCPPR